MDTSEFFDSTAGNISSLEYNNLSEPFYEDKCPLLVLVEDQEDKPFWSKLFSCISNNYESIDVWPLKEASAHAMQQTDASGNPLTATGKEALMKVNGLCNKKVIAIDADLDLLTDYHYYSARVRTDKYVIHTTYYSIENHLLAIATIPNLSVNWSDPQATIDWNHIFNSIGNAICNAVKLNVASIIHRDNERKLGKTILPNVLTIKNINYYFGNVVYNPSSFLNNLTAKKTTFESSALYSSLSTQCTNEFISLRHWNVQDCLHTLQGHSLYNLVVKAIKYHCGSNDDVIHNSIYSATQLDMTSPDIVAIQNQIKQI